MATEDKFKKLANKISKDPDFSGMNDEDFGDLVEALKEVDQIIAEERAKRTKTEFHPSKIRRRLRMSQERFASSIGVNTSTLRNWEQGRVKIPAVAQTLFKIISEHPETIAK